MTQDQTADAILQTLAAVLPGITETLGRSIELVLHDYRKAPASVVAVAGQVTNRRANGSISEIGLRMLAQGDDASNDLNYVTRTSTGKLIKSSTLPIRDTCGHVFGALCINVDVTAIQEASRFLSELGSGVATEDLTTTFTNNFDEVLAAAIRGANATRQVANARLSTTERLTVVQALDQSGVFSVRGAVPRVAAHLGVSRASVYADLKKTRNNALREKRT